MSKSDLKTTKTKVRELAKQRSLQSSNMLFQIVNNKAYIIFNRPKIMNAFSFDMYFSFVEFIEKANELENVKYIVLQGAGGNFSSGNDLNNFMMEELSELEPLSLARAMAEILRDLTEVIMKSKKPIFALVQGRTIGFAFTQLALYDRVFAVKKSLFMAPLVRIAQGPQMASSYLFPKIFGQPLAQQLIIKARPMKPEQLQSYGFLTCHENIEEAKKAMEDHISQLQKLDWASYVEARKLMILPDKQNILRANSLQCQNLVQRWSNPNLPQMMMKYMADKKQKPKL